MEQADFDLTLMDIQMPEMSGFEITAIVRERERKTGAHMPIVAMTAYAMKGDRERCLEAGMDDYISKPIQTAELYRVITKLAPEAGERRVTPQAHENQSGTLNPATALAQVGCD